MSGKPDHRRDRLRPYLIEPDEAGGWRLVVRETRYNSQNYPLISSTPVEETFGTATAARAYAKAHFGAVAGDFAKK